MRVLYIASINHADPPPQPPDDGFDHCIAPTDHTLPEASSVHVTLYDQLHSIIRPPHHIPPAHQAVVHQNCDLEAPPPPHEPVGNHMYLLNIKRLAVEEYILEFENTVQAEPHAFEASPGAHPQP